MADIPIIPARATIEDVTPLTRDTAFFRVTLNYPLSTENFTYTPGQFVQISVPAAGEIPVTLAGIPNKSIELCIRNAGHVTSALHQLQPGSEVGLRGAFGNGFPVEEWLGKEILLLAGGLGIAPLRSLLHYLLQNRSRYGTITLMYGAREPSALLFREELAALSCRKDLRMLLTVDFLTEYPPGNLVCNAGLLPDLLRITEKPGENTVAAVCGPPPLYRCVIEQLKERGVSGENIFLSLERRMKCGTGLCCHCAVGSLFCCTDGPVFRYSEIKDIQEAI